MNHNVKSLTTVFYFYTQKTIENSFSPIFVFYTAITTLNVFNNFVTRVCFILLNLKTYFNL